MISSTSNQKMKQIMQLNKKAKARREMRAFVVEGIKMFRETPAELLLQVYVSESFLSVPGQREEVARKTVSYETVSDTVFSHVCDTTTPQGILCVVKMPNYSLDDLLKKKAPTLLLLEDIQDPGNLGTMFRTGEGAGIDGIIMTKETVDLFHPKTVRSTMGSIYRMPFYITDQLQETLELLHDRGVCTYAAHLKGTKSYDAFDYTKPTAFLIGNEGNGLTDAIADQAKEYLRIPMEGQLESLNAAMAAGILMYEAYRQRRG